MKIGGKYTLVRKLKAGGYGEVWIVEDRQGRRLALKRLLDRAADFIASLRDEAVKLFHLRGTPGVVTLVDHDLDGEDPYIVMELADGSLADRINGPIPPKVASSIMIAVIAALREVHGRGVVHRDIKPDNILLKGNGLILADFGLGKGAGSLLMTVGGAGTPGYMAPEQKLGPATRASDVYSVGATLFHLLTGKRPPSDVSELDPRWVVEDCPQQLVELVLAMTTRAPHWRPSLEDAETTLSRYLRSQPLVAAPASTPSSTAGEIMGGLAVGGLLALGIYGVASAFGGRGRR